MPQSCFVSLPELRWNSPAFIHYHYSTHPFYTPPQFASPIHPLYSNRLVSGMFGNNYVQRFGIQPVLLQWLAIQCLRSLWFFCLDLENDWAHMTYIWHDSVSDRWLTSLPSRLWSQQSWHGWHYRKQVFSNRKVGSTMWWSSSEESMYSREEMKMSEWFQTFR